MGTTLTFAYVLWPLLYLVHVGDSRGYLLRDGELLQLTHDHTLAQRLVDRGAVEPERSGKIPGGETLWNAVGAGPEKAEPQVHQHRLREGDVLLLCTDGLTRAMGDPEIHEILQGSQSSRETCQRLVKASNLAGGPDNVTVVVARYRPPDVGPVTGEGMEAIRAEPGIPAVE
jgi:protein phosphatase